MRIVCPFTNLHPLAAAEIRAQAPAAEFVDVSGSPIAYWELLAELWERQEDFALIEHDVLIAPGTIEHFESCPQPWCSSAVQLQSNRFRREVMVDHPDLLRDVDAWGRHWACLDNFTVGELTERGEDVHVHEKPSEHLGAVKSEQEQARRGASLDDYRWPLLRSAYVARCRAKGVLPQPEPSVQQRGCEVMFEHLRRTGGRLRAPESLMEKFREYLLRFEEVA